MKQTSAHEHNNERRAAAEYAIGIDIGGSGARLVAVAIEERRGIEPPGKDEVKRKAFTANGPGAKVGADGVRIGDTLHRLHDEWVSAISDGKVVSVGVGMTGLATLADNPAGICRMIAGIFGCCKVAVAADAFTAHLGALGGHSGAVVAAGTGVIGFGTDYRGICKRVDGWGHLLGDHGGGAWIGMRGLQSALDAYSGRIGLPSEPLLEHAIARFGQPESWPRQLYKCDNRAGVLASFVPDVMNCAANGDVASLDIVRKAGEALASTACAALADGLPHRIAYAGSILERCALVREPFLARLRELVPDGEFLAPQGTPLDGALRLSLWTFEGRIHDQPPYVYVYSAS